jgi:hypothetical protein
VSQFIRRRVFQPDKKYKRPYRLKHSKRTGKPSAKQVEEHILEHPELLQMNVEVEAPPKSYSELASRLFLEFYKQYREVWLPSALQFYRMVYGAVEESLQKEESKGLSDEKLKELEKKAEIVATLCKALRPWLSESGSSVQL